MNVIKENSQRNPYEEEAYPDGRGRLIGYDPVKGQTGSPEALLKARKKEKEDIGQRPPYQGHHPFLPRI